MERTLSFKIRSETKDDSKNTSEKSNVRNVNAESKKFLSKRLEQCRKRIMFGNKFLFKGTVSIISSCKVGKAQFTTVSLNFCPIKYKLDFNVYYPKSLPHFYCRKTSDKKTLLILEKRQYIFHIIDRIKVSRIPL